MAGRKSSSSGSSQVVNQEGDSLTDKEVHDISDGLSMKDDSTAGPPHRSSVLGYTLFSLGFDVLNDGPDVLGIRGSSLARIISGQAPTVIGMMHDIEDLIDALERDTSQTKGPHPFLQTARALLRNKKTRLNYVMDADPGIIVHPSSEERGSILQSITVFEQLSYEDGWGDDRPRDTGSLFGACCRIVGWGRSEVVDQLHTTVSLARALIDGREIPKKSDWLRVIMAYDREVESNSPIGVGIRWASNKSERESIELEFSAAGDGPILFEDKGE